jgi:hypothetical protein
MKCSSFLVDLSSFVLCSYLSVVLHCSIHLVEFREQITNASICVGLQRNIDNEIKHDSI